MKPDPGLIDFFSSWLGLGLLLAAGLWLITAFFLPLCVLLLHGNVASLKKLIKRQNQLLASINARLHDGPPRDAA